MESFTMNEVNRLKVIHDIVDRRLTTHLAAERLGIPDRHCRYLLKRYRADGPLGMTNAHNYQLLNCLTKRAIQIIREHYADLGPTLACGKLTELHSLTLSKETVRKLILQSDSSIPRCANCQTHAKNSFWQLSAIADAKLKRPMDIYLKVNSGMNRLGFAPERLHAAWLDASANPNIGKITLMTLLPVLIPPGVLMSQRVLSSHLLRA